MNVPKIQMVVLTHCGWSTVAGARNEPNQQTKVYLKKVYDILSKHRTLLSTNNPENHLFMLDDFLGSGRISSIESKPMELLQEGKTKAIDRVRVSVNKSVDKCKNQLNLKRIVATHNLLYMEQQFSLYLTNSIYYPYIVVTISLCCMNISIKFCFSHILILHFLLYVNTIISYPYKSVNNTHANQLHLYYLSKMTTVAPSCLKIQSSNSIVILDFVELLVELSALSKKP